MFVRLRLRGAVMLLNLLNVLGLEVSVLVITVRFFERDRDDVEDIRRLLEDVVHFLERAVPCLWIEEPDDRENACVAARRQLRVLFHT